MDTECIKEAPFCFRSSDEDDESELHYSCEQM